MPGVCVCVPVEHLFKLQLIVVALREFAYTRCVLVRCVLGEFKSDLKARASLIEVCACVGANISTHHIAKE